MPAASVAAEVRARLPGGCGRLWAAGRTLYSVSHPPRLLAEIFMRFTLLDRVLDIVPGKSITAVKTVTLSEEYLADHFPRFPVLPGVLMLEAMTQAAAWTIRLGEDFAHSIVVLRSAKNVKYGDFAEPGRVLMVTGEVLGQDETTTRIKANGSIDGRTCLTARLVLERYNLADRRPHGAAIDVRVRAEMRRLWAILHPAGRPAVHSATAAAGSAALRPEPVQAG